MRVVVSRCTPLLQVTNRTGKLGGRSIGVFSFFFRRASMHFREDAATLSAVNMRVNFIVGVLGVRP